ncbi:MAG: helix-turn-helix domain-containing protein [Candidatus Rokuibacteriota bacterium]
MGRNRGFGRRVQKAREERGISRKTLARLTGINVERIEMIEMGQVDETDFGHLILERLADVLDKPLQWLVTGEMPGPVLSDGALAQRPARRETQLFLDLGSSICPHCHRAVRSGRCDNCGRPVE